MNGLDLFSGIGGITLALKEWVTPVAYCEINPYARAVLVSRMSDGQIPTAPIWDDVTTLHGHMLPVKPDIIYGGFPCQDISVAGRGAGLAGERSGLFYEIARLVGEIRPSFVFLENVPAITIRGLRDVVGEFSRLRYDCRWGILSASDMGAPHRRDRWWLLAHAAGVRRNTHGTREFVAHGEDMAHPKSKQSGRIQQSGVPADARTGSEIADRQTDVLNASGVGRERGEHEPHQGRKGRERQTASASGGGCGVPDTNGKGRPESGCAWERWPDSGHHDWWSTEPNVGRVAHGIPARVDRLTGLGNAVVPATAKEAFKRLCGMK